MRKFTRILLTLTVAGALLCGGAMAAGGDDIKVQLDGQELTFTDAHPQMKNDRTFLPVRAVFEAVGAQVSYNEETLTVTAVRGEKTIQMTMGSTELTVTEGGVSRTITMDVAPYIDETTWRTYIPVRFAAEALDCLVGWVEESNTAVIVNTDKLLKDAQAGKHFTYLEKVARFAEKYDEGIWDISADVTGDVSADVNTLFGSLSIPVGTLEGKATGTTQNDDTLAVDMSMKMDMAALAALAGDRLTGEGEALFGALAAQDMALSMRMDRTAGTFYVNMAAQGLAPEELDPNTWYEMDLAELMGQTGVEALTVGGGADIPGLLNGMLASGQNINSTTAYSEIKAMTEGVYTALADESFRLDENGLYTVSYSLENGGTVLEFYLSLALTDDVLVGYEMGVARQVGNSVTVMAVGMTNDGQVVAVVQVAQALEGEQLAQLLEDPQVAQVLKGADGTFTVTMTMRGAYTQGTKAPQTQPPTGATVKRLEDLAGVLPLSLEG